MMDIYAEDESRLLYIKYNNGNITKKRINSKFNDFNFQSIEGKNVFLLDESRFVFFSFNHHDFFLNKINIKFIEHFVNSKVENINENYGKIGYKLFYHIDDIYIDGVPQDYLIGLKGEVSFVLKLFYFTIEDYFRIKSVVNSDVFFKQNITFYPKSFYTLNYLKRNTKIRNINLLYIQKEEVVLINILDGFYNDYQKIPLGLDKLKSIFKDDNILGLYYDSFLKKDLSEFSLKLIQKLLNLYSRMLANRILENKKDNNNILLISNIIKNRYFLDIFSNVISKTNSGFVIPYHFSKDLNLFRKNWNFSELDLLIYLNIINSSSL